MIDFSRVSLHQKPKIPFQLTFSSHLVPHETEESLLTLRTLGLQTRTLSPCYLLPATTRFIPTTQIRDVFIHEAFRGFEVRYYLAVVVKDEKDVVVVFPVSAIFSFPSLSTPECFEKIFMLPVYLIPNTPLL